MNLPSRESWPTAAERAHLRHLGTNELWHDDCHYCRERRVKGGIDINTSAGVPPEPGDVVRDAEGNLWVRRGVHYDDLIWDLVYVFQVGTETNRVVLRGDEHLAVDDDFLRVRAPVVLVARAGYAADDHPVIFAPVHERTRVRVRYHVCVDCRETFSEHDAHYGPDPYDSEINHVDDPVWLCHSCYVTHVAEV